MKFHGFRIFIISLHVIFVELTIYYIGYLTAVKFRWMYFLRIFQNSENYMHAKISGFTVPETYSNILSLHHFCILLGNYIICTTVE